MNDGYIRKDDVLSIIREEVEKADEIAVMMAFGNVAGRMQNAYCPSCGARMDKKE